MNINIITCSITSTCIIIHVPLSIYTTIYNIFYAEYINPMRICNYQVIKKLKILNKNKLYIIYLKFKV